MTGIEDIPVRYAAAVWERDVADFLSLYDPDVIVFDLWGRSPYRGIDAWARSVADWFGSLTDGERVRAAFTPISSLIDGDAATWCGSVQYLAVDGDDTVLRTMRNRLTWSLRRRGNGWRIVHEHTSAPVDLETMGALLDDVEAP